MFGSTSPSRIRQRGTPSASAAATKSRSTIGCAAPRVTRATRGIVVSPTASTMQPRPAGRRVAIATSASMICGKARITSMARIRTSSSTLRGVGRDQADRRRRATRPRAVASTAITRMLRPPHRNRLQHVLAEVVGAEARALPPGLAFGHADERRRAVGREERADDRRSATMSPTSSDADPRAPQPQRPRAAALAAAHGGRDGLDARATAGRRSTSLTAASAAAA